MRPEPPQAAEIVDLDHEGRGVARQHGKTVFVESALPGERVHYSVYRRKRQFDLARLVAIDSASPDRVEPRCAHFGVCGGCSLQHYSADAQVRAKQRQLLEDLARIGRIAPRETLSPLRGPDWAYRRRARLGARFVRKKGRVLVGFRERSAPYLADLARCEVLAAPWQSLPAQLAALLDVLSIREQIPQVEFAAGDAAAALVFRVLQPLPAGDCERLYAFGRDHGIVVYVQTAGPDSIKPLGEAAEHFYELEVPGSPRPIRIRYEPSDFIQVNGAVNNQMVRTALERLAPLDGAAVLDLYCGLGNFSLAMAASGAKVTGVEGSAALVERARRNAAANRIDGIDFFSADLSQPQDYGEWARRRYQAVLLDPPRTGARDVMPLMGEWQPRRVVYISCHTGTLARDAGLLTTQGYDLIAAGVMDMFPHTNHIESIAVFERA